MTPGASPGMSSPQPPQRVVITSPRARATPARPQRGPQDLDEATTVGEVYLRSLVRAQLRLALTVCAVVAAVAGGLPLMFALVPETRSAEVLGLGLPWLLLGVLAYPALIAGGWVYVRLAERTERTFADLIAPARAESPPQSSPESPPQAPQPDPP